MRGIYLALSITTRCNLKCFYCKPAGESICGQKGDMLLKDIKCITEAAYNEGVTKFRLTGGECTIHPHFGEIVTHILGLGNDVRINICSNGAHILDYLDLLKSNKDRINIRISVDTTQKALNGIEFDKYLSPSIEEITKILVANGIRTRYNIVVTSYNKSDILTIINKALLLGVDIKLLDLYIQEVYLGNESNKRSSSEQFWEKTYESLTQFIPELEQICDHNIVNDYDEDSAYGIPMRAYKYKNQLIILKDSSKGANFSVICKKLCQYYSNCQEGMYVPFVSVGNVLHINGCHNKNLQWNLNNASFIQIREAFKDILSIFSNLEIRQESSEQFRKHNSYIIPT